MLCDTSNHGIVCTDLFQYYRNRDTGDLYGQREVEVSCGNSAKKMFLSNLIRKQLSSDGETFYEITSPTARQVVRNHFDCQSMTGARLSAPQLGSDGDTCEFSALDFRYHCGEDMASISHNADAALTVTRLSLALLEDSSWYRSNFTGASTPLFGRAVGCGFEGIFEDTAVRSAHDTDNVCPSNCSGEGVCDYFHEMPSCICDNPFDESLGCFDSK